MRSTLGTRMDRHAASRRLKHLATSAAAITTLTGTQLRRRRLHGIRNVA
ncbi:hypothetical protein [Dactylosporangium cerinum]